MRIQFQSSNLGVAHECIIKVRDPSLNFIYVVALLTAHLLQQQKMVKKKRKCHRNRKLRYFEIKCRVRDLNEEEITILIRNKNDTISERSLND
jgi:hypothetical protein